MQCEWQSDKTLIEDMQKKIDKLEKSLKEIERFQDITHEEYKLNIKRKKPHKCPVCEGEGYYALCIEACSFKLTSCESCEGKGIVWG
jgi:DnaJ-class molecular chaperone